MKIKNVIKRILSLLRDPVGHMNSRFAFSNRWPGIIFNPFYFARKNLYNNIKDLGQRLYGDVLDVGCGMKPYISLIPCKKYIGLEYDSPENRKSKAADLFYDGGAFPLKNNTFDCVLSSQVLEHVFTPFEFISEISRILKPGGLLLLTVPFVWDEHEQPYDFARYSSFGLKSLLEKNGFEILEQRKTCNNITVIFQLWNDYVYKKLIGRGKQINFLSIYILTAPSNCIGLILNCILPSNDDLFLDNIVLAKKKDFGK